MLFCWANSNNANMIKFCNKCDTEFFCCYVTGGCIRIDENHYQPLKEKTMEYLRITSHGLQVQQEINFRIRDGWTLESSVMSGTGFDLVFYKET